MVRRVIAVALSLAVQGAALSVPLVHAHLDDHATDHHGGRTVHSHWSGHDASHHSSDLPALESQDHDRAVFLGAFAAVASRALPTVGLVHAAFVLPVPGERTAHQVVEVTHGHDPPFLRSRSTRAPPAFLS